jgi:hypothetical protein
MNPGSFKLKLADWEYTLSQDPTSGDLTVLSFRSVGLVEKAVEYAKAEASAVGRTVELSVLDQRRDACVSCDSVEDNQGNLYCNKCGCPKWERSRLQVKWKLPGATCPLGKWPQ